MVFLSGNIINPAGQVAQTATAKDTPAWAELSSFQLMGGPRLILRLVVIVLATPMPTHGYRPSFLFFEEAWLGVEYPEQSIISG